VTMFEEAADQDVTMVSCISAVGDDVRCMLALYCTAEFTRYVNVVLEATSKNSTAGLIGL